MSNIDLWVEKYRPKTLEDLIISKEAREIIVNFGQNIPNLLFCGKQGTGKTSLARILVQDVLKCDYLYVNASDETGIDNIRNKVTGFSQTKSLDGNLKVVILDEADYLSMNAQGALRNLVESYLMTTRFILTGNYRHKIIPALQSRCQSLDIQPSFKEAVLRCYNILKNENISLENDQKDNFKSLIKKYFPDLRKCINELQKHSIGGVFTMDSIDNNELLSFIWKNIKSKSGLATRKYLIENESLFNSDWDQLMIDLLNFIYDQNTTDLCKKSMIIIIADHLEKASRVLDKEINFFGCILNLETV